MPTRTASYTTYYDPVTRTHVRRGRRRRRSNRVTGLGALGNFGQASGLKGTMSSIKGVLITGTIAAAGAIITDQVYERIGASLGLAGWKRDLAKMATGIALGLVIAKFLKKPRLAAAFAIGPVVAGALNLFGDVMGNRVSGLGAYTFTPSDAINSMYAPLYGANAPGLAAVNTFQQYGPRAAEFMQPAPPLSDSYAMPGL